jgi:ABC-type antimicrobial peptide transport system permease subunit
VREGGLNDGETGVMYIPQSQVPEGITTLVNQVIPLSWLVRTAMDPLTMRQAIEREFRSTDNTIVVSRERTMEQVVAASVQRQNFNMLLLSIFAGIALLLAAIGIYGLMAYSVEQRTQEIGIRMALGAGRGDMVKLVLWQGMKLAGFGVMFGAALSYGVTWLLKSMLFGVKPGDPLTVGGVALILSAVALVATYVPARRASAIDPGDALRYQ